MSKSKHSHNKKTTNTHKKNLSGKSSYTFLFAILLILLIFFTYATIIQSGFIANYDDNIYLLNNPKISSLSIERIKGIFTEFWAGNYHPLTTLTYAVEVKIWGLNPKPFHTTNLILHIINSLLVFWLAFHLLKKAFPAFIVAGLFAVHPMHVEPVAWIASRKDLLYSLFYLLALISYLQYLKKDYTLKDLIYCFVLFILSCLSKSMAVTLPLILLLFDFLVKRKLTPKMLLEKIPFFIISILFGILAILSQKASGTIYSALPFSWIDRIFIISYELIFYLWKFVLPTGLSVVHFYPEKSPGLPPAYYLAPVIVIVIIILIIKNKTKLPLIFGFGFLVVSLLPVLQFIPVGQFMVAERYTYLSYLGLLIVVGFMISNWLERKKNYSIVIIMSLLVLITFSIVSRQRVMVWKDGLTLFTDALKKNPGEPFVLATRGNELLHRERYEEAIQDFSLALRNKPGLADTWHNRGVAYYNLKKYSQAIADYTQAIQLQPNNANAYYSRGLAYYNSGNMKQALDDYNRVEQLAGNYLELYNNRGVVKGSLNDLRGSISDFSKAIAAFPEKSDAWFNRGNSYLLLNMPDSACNDYRQAAALQNQDAIKMMQQYCK